MYNLKRFIDSPFDPKINFDLGYEYEKINQTASAASFYLRSAERTLDLDLQYAALLRNATCFEKQGKRDLTTKTLLQRAIAIKPDRPEGYYFLSKLYERRREFHDCYMVACVGLDTLKNDLLMDSRLPEYLGEYALLFQKAVSAWWVGLTDESRDILFDLHFNYELDDLHKEAVRYNLKTLGYPERKHVYFNSYLDTLRYKFKGVETITNNFSQVFQDLFVLTLLDGKRNGTYLEIGSSDPFYNNNTALLEQTFGWTGLSIEIKEEDVKKFSEQRKNPVVCGDAQFIDYTTLMNQYGLPDVVDYLQVDCDPPPITFTALQKIIETGRKFRIIQFEHDYYVDKSVRDKSRSFLKKHGYELRVPNVSFNHHNGFEDWWVLPGEVDDCFKECINNEVNFVRDMFFDT